MIDWDSMTSAQAEALASGFYAAEKEVTYWATEQTQNVISSEIGYHAAIAATTQEREGEQR